MPQHSLTISIGTVSLKPWIFGNPELCWKSLELQVFVHQCLRFDGDTQS